MVVELLTRVVLVDVLPLPRDVVGAVFDAEDAAGGGVLVDAD